MHRGLALALLTVAATCYLDNSPPPVVREIAPGIKAVRGEGRPSKRLRRELERMRRIPGA
jgi:ribosome-associated heat shock protein Hsp15